jgi:menaquinone-9 beta-reductase
VNFTCSFNANNFIIPYRSYADKQEKDCMIDTKKTSETNHVSDFLVVGGGPAGATAAYYLAKAGKNVILLDRQSFPRDKVCGDFVSQIAIRELQELAISQLPEFENSNVIKTAAVFVDGEKLVTADMPSLAGLTQPGRIIPRKKLDNWILDATKKAGATVLENFLVTSFTVENNQVRVLAQNKIDGASHIFQAKLLIGADGSNSVIANILHGYVPPKANRIIGMRGYFEGVQGPVDRADMHFSSKSFPGYCWLFPTEKGEANVGLGVLLETMPQETHPKALFDKLIEEDAGLKARLSGAKLKASIQTWPLNVYNPHAEVIGERVILVGEAAGLVNPLNGEGIQYALLSGKWAAQTALNCNRKDDYSQTALAEYSMRIKDELDYGFKLSALIVQFIRNRHLNPLWLGTFEVMLARAKSDPQYAGLAGGILSGLMPPTEGLTPKFMLNTMQEAVTTTGQKIMVNPTNLPQDALKFTQTTLKIAQESARDPVGFLEWSMGTAFQAAEFAATIPMRMLRDFSKDKTESNQTPE